MNDNGEIKSTKKSKENQFSDSSKINYKTVLESINDIVIVGDTNSNILYVNNVTISKLGYSFEELQKLGIIGLHPTNLQKEANEIFADMISGQREYCPLPILCKDGTILPVETRISFGKWNGEDCIIGTCKDLSVEQEAKQLFERLFQNNPSPMALSTFTDRRFVNVNKSFLKTLGFTKEEIIGKTSKELNLFEDIDSHDFAAQLLQNRGILEETELKLRDRNGAIHIGIFYGEIIESQGQKYLLTVMLDITKRKQIEDSLKRNEQKLSEAMKMAFAGHWDYDVINDMFTFSDTFYNVYRTSAEEVGGYHMTSAEYAERFVHPDDRHVVAEEVKNIMNTTDPNYSPDIEHRIIYADGETGHILVRHFIVKDENGKTIRTFGVNQDITERKKQENELRENNERFLAMFNNHNAIMLLIEPHSGQIINANLAALRFYGFTLHELCSRTIDEINILSSEEIKRERENAAYRDKNYFVFPHKISNGEIRTVEVHSTPIKFENTTLLFSIIHDITEVKHLQEQKSRSERLEMAGTVAVQVAHDFNNLLGPLMAYPELIRDELPKNHSTLELLDQIEIAAKRISDINQDLLAMGRRGHYDKELVCLNELINITLNDFEKLPHTLIIDKDLCEDLMNVKGGSAQLSRMLSNLIHNAIDAMAGIGTLSIKSENYYVDKKSIDYSEIPIGEYVKLTISDTGTGIAPDVVQKIFDPFFTTKKANKKRGSGLGMSVVDAVIKDHNGFIDLKTKVGVGTSFYIYFPFSREVKKEHSTESVPTGNEKNTGS